MEQAGYAVAAFREGGMWRCDPLPLAVLHDLSALLSALRSQPPEGGPFVLDAGKLKELGITPREYEILGLIAEGLSNREIGERLFVSENTVKTHSSRVFEKLGVNRRVQAVLKGREHGLIP